MPAWRWTLHECFIWVNPDNGLKGSVDTREFICLDSLLEEAKRSFFMSCFIWILTSGYYSLSFRNKGSTILCTGPWHLLYRWDQKFTVWKYMYILLCRTIYINTVREILEEEGKAIKYNGRGCWLSTKIHIFLFLRPQQEGIFQPSLLLAGARWLSSSY